MFFDRYYTNDPDGGVVYFVQCDSPDISRGNGAIKIGRSGNRYSRLASLQTGCPFPLRVRFEIMVKPAVDAENWLHHRFNRLRLRGEWFSWHPDLELLFAELKQRCDTVLEIERAERKLTSLSRVSAHRPVLSEHFGDAPIRAISDAEATRIAKATRERTGR